MPYRFAEGLFLIPLFLAVLLVGAPPAHAAKGVVGFFGNLDSSTTPSDGGRFFNPRGIAVNVNGTGGAGAGDVYVVDSGKHRIQQFDADGNFIRAWGRDVIIGGRPNNAGTNEIQRVTVSATAGTFTLTFGAQTTSPIAFDAPAATLQTAINGLSSLANAGSSVTVTGGPGGPGGATPYFVTFNGGPVQGTDPAQMTAASQLTGTIAVATTTPGLPSPEICDTTALPPNDPADCKGGLNTGSAFGGEFSSPEGIAVDQSNGHVFVAERGRLRVQEFDATGHFIRAWGRDVVSTGAPNNISTSAFEVCDVTAGNTAAQCKAGASGTLGGNFSNGGAFTGIAVAPAGAPNAGNVLVADPNSRRIHEFDPDAPDGADAGTSPDAFVRTFGWDVISSGQPGNLAANEQQTVKVAAAGGTYTLKFGANTTVPIPYDAPPSGGVGPAASLQNALEAIASVGAGNVSVTGGPGDATGSTPYAIEFKGTRADQDLSQITAEGDNLQASIGDQLSCFYTLSDNPKRRPDQPLAYQWLRNGVPIPGAMSDTYQTVAADAGTAVQCQITGRKLEGWVHGLIEEPNYNTPDPTADMDAGVTQASPARLVAPAPATLPPTHPTQIPFVTRIAEPGETLKVGAVGGVELVCHTGTWGGAPTSFSFQWYRNGLPLSGKGNPQAQTYTVQTVDLAKPAIFQCAVTATNAGGSVTKMTQTSYTGGEAFHHYTSPPPCDKYVEFMTNENYRCDQMVDLPDKVTISSQATVDTAVVGARFEVCTAESSCKAAPTGSATGQFGGGGVRSLAADEEGAVYVADPDTFRVAKFIPQVGPPALAPSIFGSVGAPGGVNETDSPLLVALDGDGDVLVARSFPAGATAACPDGPPSIVGEVRIQEITADGATLKETHGECSGLLASQSTSSQAAGLIANPLSGDLLLAHSNRDSAPGYGQGVFIFNDQPKPTIELDQPEPTTTTTPLIGVVDPTATTGHPSPPGTAYQVEYRLDGATGWTKFRSPTLLSPGPAKAFKITVTGLRPNSIYDVRVSGVKRFNSSYAFSPERTFTTPPAPPTIRTFSSSHVQASSATLNATIDPRGSETTYHFEYGTTEAYGGTSPEVSIGDGQGPQKVSVPITGLGDVVYHFRVVATSVGGTTTSEDQTFVFHPPPCPNRTIRQQTGANYLPDCRAYELVSPEFHGSTILLPFFGPNSALAKSPSRLAFFGVFGAITGTEGEPPNANAGDLYVSTRTDFGWTTRYVGRPGHQTFTMGGPPGLGTDNPTPKGMLTNSEMDRFLSWDNGNTNLIPNPFFSNAPYLFDAFGKELQRWPTNLDQVPGGERFIAHKFQLIANDELTHYAFVSDIPFSGDGVPGDLFLNDTVTGTVEVINRDENGASFTASPLRMSADGSRVLMTDAAIAGCVEGCPPIPAGTLYLHEGGSTINVTRGHDAHFAGMTADSSIVYFTSDGQVTADDHDNSLDLFRWEAASDSVARVSAGSGGAGDTDDCVALDGWTDSCDVLLVSEFERNCGGLESCKEHVPHFFSGYSKILAGEGGNGHSDSFLGRASGDVYFFSPEQLDGPEKGVADAQNLYVLRDGKPQFVARFDGPFVCSLAGSLSQSEKPLACAESPIARMRVSADGRFAAFITNSQLTDYDNAGRLAMYRYDALRDDLICVSCRPDGEPPTGRVLGSTNGLFMTDDGRAFFSTGDALDPRDTNDSMDVYEYVAGRAQLITAGVGRGFEDPGGGIIQGITSFSRPGLIGVSADGTDVYFATYDVLAPQDQNGGNLKIYNARTGGGFPYVTPAPGCAAADECHGPVSPGLASLRDGTGAHLGQTGQVRPERRATNCKKPRIKKSGRCVKRSTKNRSKNRLRGKDRPSNFKRGGRR